MRVDSLQILGKNFVGDFAGNLAGGENHRQVRALVGNVDSPGGVEPDSLDGLEIGNVIAEHGLKRERLRIAEGWPNSGDSSDGIEEEEMAVEIGDEMSGLIG